MLSHLELQKKIEHDAAKEEVMQKENLWHFGNAFLCWFREQHDF